MPVPLPNFVRRHVCRTGCIGAVHTCVRHQAGGPQAAIRQKPSFLLERKKYALRTSTSASAFPSRSPVAISDSTTFSASDGGVDAYSSGLACVLYSFATHLARTLGFPGCPLSVSAHHVLMGAFPVSRRHTSLGTLTYILCRRMYATSSCPALAHSSGSSHPPLLSASTRLNPLFSAFSWMTPRILFASSALLLCSRISSSCLSFFSCSSNCTGSFVNPRSRLFPPFDRVFGVDPGMSMRAVAFSLQPHPGDTLTVVFI